MEIIAAFVAGMLTVLVLIAVLHLGARLHALADRMAAEVMESERWH